MQTRAVLNLLNIVFNTVDVIELRSSASIEIMTAVTHCRCYTMVPTTNAGTSVILHTLD